MKYEQGKTARIGNYRLDKKKFDEHLILQKDDELRMLLLCGAKEELFTSKTKYKGLKL